MANLVIVVVTEAQTGKGKKKFTETHRYIIEEHDFSDDDLPLQSAISKIVNSNCDMCFNEFNDGGKFLNYPAVLSKRTTDHGVVVSAEIRVLVPQGELKLLYEELEMFDL